MSRVASEASETLLALSFVPGIGQRTLLRLAEHPQFLETNLEEMASLFPKVTPLLTPEVFVQVRELAQDNLLQARLDGASLVSVLDEEYPFLLQSTPDKPPFLFVKGQLQPTQCVAVIGTREPTEHGAETARRATTYLASRGWSIISGLAIGCDAIAHRAALDAGGHTVAVLAHGLQMVAPRQHTSLAAQILEQGGALVSEYPYGTKVFPPQYVKRDRIQAGMAQGVLMVQSDVKGGSLHACRASLDYGRVLAVPKPTLRDFQAHEPKVQGNLVILGEGHAAAALLKCKEKVLQHLVPLRSRDDYPHLEQALSSQVMYEPAGLF